MRLRLVHSVFLLRDSATSEYARLARDNVDGIPIGTPLWLLRQTSGPYTYRIGHGATEAAAVQDAVTRGFTLQATDYYRSVCLRCYANFRETTCKHCEVTEEGS